MGFCSGRFYQQSQNKLRNGFETSAPAVSVKR